MTDIDKLLEEAEKEFGPARTLWAGSRDIVIKLIQAVRELRESNNFLSEAIDAAIKDREYYEKRHAEINTELGIRESEVQRLLTAAKERDELRAKLERAKDGLTAIRNDGVGSGNLRPRRIATQALAAIEIGNASLGDVLISKLIQAVRELETAYNVRNDEVTGLSGQNAELRDRNGLYEMEVRELRRKLKLAKEALDKINRGDNQFGPMHIHQLRNLAGHALAAIENG